MPETRCPTDDKLIAVLSDDFAGDVSLFCPRCDEPFGSSTPVLPRLECRCGKWLHSGIIVQGGLRTACRRCRVLVELSPTGATWLEPPYRKPKPVRPKPITGARIVALVEERWELLRLNQAHHRADIAVGLRFDVFNRDAFRCRYCGHGPSDGVLLEADHVIPRVDGGPDTLANLVTACQDCNRGKSAKRILTERAS